MRRYTYGQNFSTMNTGKFAVLQFMGVNEVAPGDTFSGRISTHAWSDTTSRPVMNRTYYDTYAFYVPYRLLYEDWPDFISNSDSAQSPLPTVTAPLDEFMEADLDIDTTGCMAWNRRAYHLIYNKYFRLPYEQEVNLDSPFLDRASQRDTTFHESCWDNGIIPDTDITIDVTGETVSVDDIRAGFSKDRFDKVRAYYGSKYTDYLAALGVKSSWSISDEPELIGKSNKDFIYRTVNATADEDVGVTNVGDPAGYFDTKNVMNIRPTFCPEHGIIVMIGVARMDVLNMGGNTSPHLGKRAQSQFYSPEWENERKQSYSAKLWSTNSTIPGEAPRFNSYRRPSNQVGKASNAIDTSLYYATFNDPNQIPSSARTLGITALDGVFTGNMGGAESVQYCSLAEWRCRKKSPIRPPQRVTGVA